MSSMTPTEPSPTIDHNDYNTTWARVNNGNTQFKNAIGFAKKTAGTWGLANNISGAKIEYFFYSGGKYGSGGELVGWADGGNLPIIILH